MQVKNNGKSNCLQRHKFWVGEKRSAQAKTWACGSANHHKATLPRRCLFSSSSISGKWEANCPRVWGIRNRPLGIIINPLLHVIVEMAWILRMLMCMKFMAMDYMIGERVEDELEFYSSLVGMFIDRNWRLWLEWLMRGLKRIGKLLEIDENTQDCCVFWGVVYNTTWRLWTM